MKRLFAVWLSVGLLVTSLRAPAQSPPGLAVQLANGFAQLSITGAGGTICEVQYVTNLAQTNAWQWATNLTLASSPLLWVDTSGQATSQRFYRAVYVPTDMVLIPAGSFTMGDALEGEYDALPLHTVYVSAFYMDQYLVTSNLWYTVTAWSSGNGYGYDNPGSGKAANHPVQTLSWYDVVKWCNAWSEQEGLTPCYYTDEGLSVVYKTGDTDNVYVNWGANGYRLPTEAEWEKAARGGLSGHRFPWGDTISESQANYFGDSEWSFDLGPAGYNATFNDGVQPYTSPTGYFGANGYGLYDMAGNVFEWCWDWYSDTYYSSSPGSDPRGPTSGSNRLSRGGSWWHSALASRCAFRWSNYLPTYADNTLGFRCVRGH